MNRGILNRFALLAATVASLQLCAEPVVYKITQWTGRINWNQEENRFYNAMNSVQDGDILELQNDITVTSDIDIRKKITVRSKEGSQCRIYNQGRTYGTKIHPGGTLTMTNVVYDCDDMKQVEDVFHLSAQTISRGVTNVARMILMDGAIIQNALLGSNSKNENAVIHIKQGAVFTMNPGSAILNCKNESNPGKGGAICCDYGTVIMKGGTIAGCVAKGAGGAIHTDGTRVDSADHYGINARGDIYISGGYITNNTCGADFFGGGIYLGNSGPVLHITGTAVISNNFSGTVADDVSTYNLENAWANRLKLVDYHESHPEGFTYAGQLFTGWVGVRYPMVTQMEDPEQVRFGAVWEYFNGDQEEARNFYWNGDNRYRGKIVDNSLVWSTHVVHELPKDGHKVAEYLESGESPIYCELSENYKMTQTAYLPANCQLIIDLKGYDLECDFHVTNETSQVVIRDSSLTKSGTVTGHRESDLPNAFVLEGGSYHTEPKPEWVASNRVVIGNYCTNHPYKVAIKVWEAGREDVVTDLTEVSLEDSTNEVRVVGTKEDGTLDIGMITFSTGDWKFMQYTNANLRVQVLAAPAVSNETTGALEEAGSRVGLFDSKFKAGTASFGQEDEFDWLGASGAHGLIKLIHITMQAQGEVYITNAVETAYFKFPEAVFQATQRKTNGQLPITVVDALLASLGYGYNRAQGFDTAEVDAILDEKQGNGLRRWENIVTGTDENQLLLSAVSNDGNGLSLNVALADADKEGRTDTGYTVKYDIRKSKESGWERVGDIQDEPVFSVPLLDSDEKSVGASGFYRITTLIIPDGTLSVTNEIPSTNIIGVLEVASTLTNTLTAVPWVALATDPDASKVQPMTVSGYINTAQLENDDSVQVADAGHIYRKWGWNKDQNQWSGAITVTRNAVEAAPSADDQALPRNSTAWVTREKPAARPFFLIGQYSSETQSLKIAAGSEANPVCTLVPNPCLTATKVNAYNWGEKPHEKDLIRIPNEKTAPIALRWDASRKEWGRLVKEPGGRGSKWNNAAEVPAGTGFWYMRCGGEFEIALPASAPVAE